MAPQDAQYAAAVMPESIDFGKNNTPYITGTVNSRDFFEQTCRGLRLMSINTESACV